MWRFQVGRIFGRRLTKLVEPIWYWFTVQNALKSLLRDWHDFWVYEKLGKFPKTSNTKNSIVRDGDLCSQSSMWRMVSRSKTILSTFRTHHRDATVSSIHFRRFADRCQGRRVSLMNVLWELKPWFRKCRSATPTSNWEYSDWWRLASLARLPVSHTNSWLRWKHSWQVYMEGTTQNISMSSVYSIG